MEANRILPDLQASLLCEQVRQEVTGNLIIIGVISALPAPKFPIKAAQLCVLNRWTAGMGTFTESVRFLGPDQTTALRTNETKFQLSDANHNISNVTVFGGLEFSEPGVYYIEVQVDQVLKIRYPVPVLLRQPAPGQQQQRPPAAPDAPAGDTPQG